jgi:hypothetical protein
LFDLENKMMNTTPKITYWKKGDEIKSEEIQQEFKKWDDCYRSDKKSLNEGVARPFQFIQVAGKKDIDGLASEFSKIKNHEQLINFASKYGNLGLPFPSHAWKLLKEVKVWDSEVSMSPLAAFSNVQPGDSYFEPIELWWHHIKTVRKILKLYRALIRAKKYGETEIEENVLRIELLPRHPKSNYDAYHINWYDDSWTTVRLTEKQVLNMDFIKIGRLVLQKLIQRFASNGIRITASEIVESPKNDLGFYVLEKKTTPYLITAIYYELWQLINADMVVEICKNPNCKEPFLKNKRSEYCSNACKQEAYRIRKIETEK